VRIASLAVVVCLSAASFASADVLAPRIATDGSVDTHSLQSIVADVLRQANAKTDEQKAVAIYEFVRRVMFHYEQRGEQQFEQHLDLDALRLVNTYGYSFCTQQMLVLVHLWQAAGLDAKFWSVPGHSTAQAFYGGKTHWFDPLIGAYVYSRDKDGGIASLKEIAEDPTVLTKAVAEKRASPTFMPCGKVLADDARRLSGNAEYAASCAALGDDVGFMVANAPKAKAMGGPRVTIFQPDWNLRRGETVTFLWDNLDGEYVVKPDAPKDELPPNHFCGVAADSKDVNNYKFWKPYAKPINGVSTCRYYANGTQVLQPVFLSDYCKNGIEGKSMDLLCWKSAEEPRLRPKKAGEPGSVVYRMSTPHIYTNGTVTLKFHRAADADASRLYVSHNSGITWQKVYDAAEAGAKAGIVDATVNVRDQVRGRRDVWFRVECGTEADVAKCGLEALKIEMVFQHNMFARPFLVPGENKVTVRAANAENLEYDRLEVTWAWKEGDQEKSDTRRIMPDSMSYTLNVAGAEMPKMLRLQMAVKP
jgi:hypothetical protein